MISPLHPSEFHTTPLLSARMVLDHESGIAGFPALSLVLVTGTRSLAAAALITKEDRISGGAVWAAAAEQAHIWASASAQGVSLADLRPLYAVLSAVAALQNVPAVARVGSALSIAPRGRFVASNIAETPWGVCMGRKGAPDAHDKLMWRYDATFFVVLGIAAEDDATFALDRASPRVLHALEAATDLTEERGGNRKRLVRRLVEESYAGVGGIVGPPERMRKLLEAAGAVASADALAPPRTQPPDTKRQPSASSVIDLVSSEDEGGAMGDGGIGPKLPSGAAAAAHGPAAAEALDSAAALATVSSVIDGLVPDVRKRAGSSVSGRSPRHSSSRSLASRMPLPRLSLRRL